MDPILRLKLSSEQRLTMTFALRQALEILHMPQIELAQWLTQEIEKNPLLEETSPAKTISYSEEIASLPSLHDHLTHQIRENFPDPIFRSLATEFIEHLDEKGFLTLSLEELSLLLSVPISRLASILEVIQTFDPPGIFARTLQESLLLQLKAYGMEKGDSFFLVRDCFDDLLQGRYSVIKRKLSSINVTEAIQKLARLSSRPANAYLHETTPFAHADLSICQTEKGWTIETQEDCLPKIELSDQYESLTFSPQEQESLRSWKAAAKWLFRSLKKRRQILLSIGAFLVRKQSAYLKQTGPLVPLTLQELADHLHLHESTVSRALHGKYAATPRGLLPLRSLLKSDPEAQSAKTLLQTLIKNEDKAYPLTDDDLCSALREKGHKVARRTVSKYRKELKIGSAARRKLR